MPAALLLLLLLAPPTAAPLLRVPFWADPPAAALQAAQVKAFLEGEPARVARLRGPQDDMLLAVVADLTGDLTLADPARQALSSALQALPRNVWAGLFRAQDGLRVLADPAADRKPALAAIAGLQVTGRAGLLETVEPAAALLAGIQRKSPVRSAVVYITDSNIYNYREDYTNPVINYSDASDLSRRFPEALIREKTSKLADTLEGYEATIFIVHLAYLRDPLNEAYQNGLRKMAEATGGTATFCRSLAEIQEAIPQTLQRAASLWMADVELPAKPLKAVTVRLESDAATLQHRTRFVRR